MDRYAESLAGLYRVVIRRVRSARPVEAAYQEDRWAARLVATGMDEISAIDAAIRLGEQLRAACADKDRLKDRVARVEAVNQVFLAAGLPPHHLALATLESPEPPKTPKQPPAAAPSLPAPVVDTALASVEGEGQHLVYKLFDRSGDLLYVGITDRGPTRLAEHYRHKPWFPEVVRVEFERFMTREICAAREAFLIKALHPRHNIQHNGAARAVVA